MLSFIRDININTDVPPAALTEILSNFPDDQFRRHIRQSYVLHIAQKHGGNYHMAASALPPDALAAILAAFPIIKGKEAPELGADALAAAIREVAQNHTASTL